MAKHDGGGRPQLDRDMMHRQLDQLLDLRERFDPDACSDPSAPSCEPEDDRLKNPDAIEYFHGKDAASYGAISLFERRLAEVVKWAFHHRMSRDAGLSDAHEDAHEHEQAGRCALAERTTGFVETDRAIMRTRIEPISELLELQCALEALDYGETREILAQSEWRRGKESFTIWQHRKKACEHYRFLYGYGYKEQRAAERVAKEYGITPDNLRKWRLRISSILGGANEAIHLAEQAGQLEARLEDDPDFGKRDGEIIDGCDDIRRRGFRNSLPEDGKRYIEALRRTQMA